MVTAKADVVIVGGGIIGVSIAYHLARRGAERVVILERETELGTGATSKATGGIRHQFSTRVNIGLSQMSSPHFMHFEDETGVDIGWRQHGYMFLATPGPSWAALQESAALQIELGVPTRILSPDEARRVLPHLRVDDLAGATFCAIDGSANPTDALRGYLRVARCLGVEVVSGAAVTAIDTPGGRVAGVRTASGTSYTADVIIDAAGPRVAEVARLVGASVPARPFRRQVFIMSRDPDLGSGIPFTVDLETGWYVHQEANGKLIFGGTDKDSRPGLEPTVDWDGLDLVARAALHRLPTVAERVTVESAYAGIRTLTPDLHAILGRPGPVEGFIVATACNGHGFMHAPAVGQLVAEIVLDSAATSLDITPLSPDRFAKSVGRDEAMVF